MPERPIEQFIQPEIERRLKSKEEAREMINRMVDYSIELRNSRLDLQAELNSLSVQPEGAREKARIEELKKNIAELDQMIANLEEFFKWTEEQGNELEIAEK